MKMWKRMAAMGLCLALAAGTLAGCGGGSAPGLALRLSMGQEAGSYDPIRAETAEAETVIVHLYENLLRKAPDTSGGTTLASGVAKKYDMEENYDGTVTYTFHLRQAKWSDGQTVTAGDFVYAWQRLADPVTNSPSASLLSAVAGYDEVRSSGDVSKLRVSAEGELTFVVTLLGKCDWFLEDVCTDPATMPLRQDNLQTLKEEAIQENLQAEERGETGTRNWASDPTRLVTNGPYTASRGEEGELILTRSETYVGGVSGPEELRFLFHDSPEAAWETYAAGEADFVSPLPRAEIEAKAESDWAGAALSQTTVLLFNTQGEVFPDVQARKAFSLAIDRQALSDLTALVSRPAEGLVPYGVPDENGEDFRTQGGDLVGESGTEEALAEANALLGESGYGSSAVPRFVYEDTEENAALADALWKAWMKGLKVRLERVPLSADELREALSAGDYDIALTDIRGNALDAESFLDLWRGDSPENVAGYENGAYDTLLKVIRSASDEKARQGCLHDAEALLLDDCPVAPLLFTASAWEAREGLVGILRDGRGFFSFASAAEVSG
ncbi:MAG: peptide ABC transporter substrate-binding protein [Dysosmobacter sp.]|nr:peptide ABC transporter substrate-binding protein [Dysosmobacter sp.]